MASANSEYKRLEVILEALYLNQVLAIVEESGASGYTVLTNVSGRGVHGVMDDPGISDVLKNVMLVTVIKEPEASRLFDRVDALLERAAGIATLTSVERTSTREPDLTEPNAPA